MACRLEAMADALADLVHRRDCGPGPGLHGRAIRAGLGNSLLWLDVQMNHPPDTSAKGPEGTRPGKTPVRPKQPLESCL